MIEWEDDLSVGVEEIDNQHKELIKRVNDLLEAMSKGAGEESLAEVIKFLENYVVEHFQAEEQYMDRYSYPEYSTHKKEHESFMTDLQEFKNKFEKEGKSALLVIRTERWLFDWLYKHIKNSDKDFGKFLRPKLLESR